MYGVQDTLHKMSALVNACFTHEIIRAQAVEATKHCARTDLHCRLASLIYWVGKYMHFVKDPEGVEALHHPLSIAKTINEGRTPFGDCDDFSMYLAALMKSIGIPATFRAVGYQGGPLSHVYVIGPNNIKLDATRSIGTPALGETLTETMMMNVKV